MKCLLIYYTGTFNTRYLTNLLKARLEKENIETDTYEIDPLNLERLSFDGYDLVGLGYPIYGFACANTFKKFIRKQRFPQGMKCFIYKNSGETYSANDASSLNIVRHIRHCKAIVENEYHFMMPYNIHFRFDEKLVKEMLVMDDKLMEIMVYEVLHDIPNLKPYKLIDKFITKTVGMFFKGNFAGNVNSFLYRIDKNKCINCDLCIRQCPTHNIYRNKKNEIRFHHNCMMCMRCSLCCPKDAFHIGYIEGWRVNGRYDFEKIKRIPSDSPYITKETKGFFKCYIRTYQNIDKRYEELFGNKD